MAVNNGKNTQFWKDTWIGELPLKLSYLKLYKYSRDKEYLVSNCCEGGVWFMDFKRPLTPVEAAQWETMVGRLNEVHLNEGGDKMIWKLEKSGCYSTKSMYKHLLQHGVVNRRMKKVWKSELPMKIKIFMRLVGLDRIKFKLNLKNALERGS
jgi:hypothetical protein